MTSEKPIIGYSSYFATADGNVYSIRRGVRRVLKPLVNQNGYARVFLYDGKAATRKRFNLHRLIYEAFNGPIECGLEINHKDGNKLNNSISNLEACTRIENMRHAKAMGLHDVGGEKNPASMLKAYQVTQIRELYKSGVTQVAIAKQFNISQPHVSRIILEQAWK